MLLYYITGRDKFEGNEQSQRRQLLQRISDAAQAGVDYIQLREKDLSAHDLELLARDAVKCVRENGSATKLLVNSRTDVALAVNADGVHLTSSDISPSDARALVAASDTKPERFVVAVSCHTLEGVRRADSHGADFAVYGPIFEKVDTNRLPIGLINLRGAAGVLTPIDRRVEAGDNRHRLPVLALGGVNVENARACIHAGAAGVAGIRLFQQGNLAETVSRLRALD